MGLGWLGVVGIFQGWVGLGMGFSLGKVLCGNFVEFLDLRNLKV